MARPRKDAVAEIEVLEQPPRKDLAYIPDALMRYFAAQGKRVSLASNDPNTSSRLSNDERFVIRPKHLGDKVEEFKELLTEECGFEFRDERFIKGDCTLYSQSYEAFERVQQEGRERGELQIGERGLAANLGLIDDLIKRHTKDDKSGVSPIYKETLQSPG